MAFAKGFRTIAGFKKAADWLTPVLVGAGNGFEYLSESLTPDAQFIPDEQVSGKATRLFGDKGNEFHSGDTMMDFRYEGLETLLAMAMGTAGVPTQVGADNAYKHVFKIADDKEGLFATFVFDKKVRVWEYTTAKVAGFTLNNVNGERLKCTFPLIPGSLNLNAGTGTNNNTTTGAITMPANRDFARFAQMTVKINAHDGGALANSDLVYVSEFGVTLNNNFPTDDVTTKHGFRVDEPVQDGFSDVTGVMNFSKYNDNAQGNHDLLAALLSKDRKKMQVTWTGPAIGATAFSLTMYFPDIQFSTGNANVPGAQRVPLNLNFSAARRTAAPTGFPVGYTDPLTIELVNQRNTDALA